MIYLDSAATTHICEEALAAFNSACREAWGNPSSGHAVGREARALMEPSRETIAGALGVPPHSLVFTSGGTESIHLALRGAAASYGRRKKHIVTTTLEHAAVYETLKALQKEGFLVTEVPPGADGRVNPGAICAAVREDTFLCAAVQVCSETGAVLDLDALYRGVKAKNPECLVCVDGVQGFLKQITVNNEQITDKRGVVPFDLYALSGHKVHAPRGIGALYVKNGVRILPQMAGGGQENGLRAGTEPVALCAALAAAVRAWAPADAGLMDLLRDGLCRGRRPRRPDCVAGGRRDAEDVVPCKDGVIIPGGSPYIMSIAFPGAPGEVLMRALSDRGVCVGIGSACSAGGRARRDKRVLQSMKLPPEVIDGAIRLSVSRFNTRDEIERAAGIIRETAEGLRH